MPDLLCEAISDMAVDREEVLKAFPGEKVEAEAIYKKGKCQWQITRPIGETNTSQILGHGATLAEAWGNARAYITRHYAPKKAVPETQRPCNADHFNFNEPGLPCTLWATGKHIVTPNGLCRCGKRFLLVEVNG